MADADSLPEDVALDLPVWLNPDIPAVARVRCAVEVNLDSGSIGLVPLAGDCERAIQTGIQAIVDRLKDLTCPVYRGSY